jgi:hypothetical protein
MASQAVGFPLKAVNRDNMPWLPHQVVNTGTKASVMVTILVTIDHNKWPIISIGPV